jgi:4-amino-4-deoxy-L-arabinose transferase-like glycosyltransferase
MPNSPRLRFLFLLLMLCGGLAALFPQVSLLPIRGYIASSRSPETTVQAARLLFGIGAVASGCVFAAWRWLSGLVMSAVTWIVALPQHVFWTLVLGWAFLLRLLVAFGLPYQPTSDALWYHEAAVALSLGQGLAVGGRLTAYRSPGYPFLLSLTYRLFGPDPSLAWLWGALSTGILVLATYHIALRLYGMAVAKLATLAIALYPALVLLTGQTMSDLPFLAGLLLLISFVLSNPPHRLLSAVIIGIAIGLLTLTRGVAIGLFGVVLAVWLVQRTDVKKLVASSVALFLAFVLSIAPWALRNYSVFGKLTLGTNLGVNAYIGNHHGASGGYGFNTAPTLSQAAFANEAEMDSELLRQAVQFVVSRPLEAALLIPKKLLHLYLLETSTVTSLFQGEPVYPSWVKYSLYGISQLCYLSLLLLFCLRVFDMFALAKRPRGAQWTGWLLASYFTLLCLIFFGQDRFRLPILPWMLIESSVFLSHVARLPVNRWLDSGKCHILSRA